MNCSIFHFGCCRLILTTIYWTSILGIRTSPIVRDIKRFVGVVARVAWQLVDRPRRAKATAGDFPRSLPLHRMQTKGIIHRQTPIIPACKKLKKESEAPMMSPLNPLRDGNPKHLNERPKWST